VIDGDKEYTTVGVPSARAEMAESVVMTFWNYRDIEWLLAYSHSPSKKYPTNKKLLRTLYRGRV